LEKDEGEARLLHPGRKTSRGCAERADSAIGSSGACPDAGRRATRGREGLRAFHRRFEIAIAGEAPLERQAERIGAGAGLFGEAGIVGLGLVDQRRVVAEIHVAKLGVPVEAEGFRHEGVELADEEIGEVEGRHLVARGEDVVAFEEAVAMGPFQHLDAQRRAARLQRPPVPQSA
jgi:hypothetical protein